MYFDMEEAPQSKDFAFSSSLHYNNPIFFQAFSKNLGQ